VKLLGASGADKGPQAAAGLVAHVGPSGNTMARAARRASAPDDSDVFSVVGRTRSWQQHAAAPVLEAPRTEVCHMYSPMGGACVYKGGVRQCHALVSLANTTAMGSAGGVSRGWRPAVAIACKQACGVVWRY
jgi:hypothetical protein